MSKKIVIIIGIIVLIIGGLSLYIINTPKEMTRMEELKAEKEKIESESVLSIVESKEESEPIVEAKEESESIEEIDENIYLEKRVTFNQELNSALLLIRQNLENSNEYTDDLSQNITDLGLVIGDYLLENTPTEKYTKSEKMLRSTLNIYSNVRLNLFYAMRDKDTETILELQKKMDGANQMMEVSNYLLSDEGLEK